MCDLDCVFASQWPLGGYLWYLGWYTKRHAFALDSFDEEELFGAGIGAELHEDR